jgi:hypothetical protein
MGSGRWCRQWEWKTWSPTSSACIIWRYRGRRDIVMFQSILSALSMNAQTANKPLVIVKGLNEWPGEFQEYGTINLYWIVCDGGIVLLLSQLLCAKDSYESCKIQVSGCWSKPFPPKSLHFWRISPSEHFSSQFI